MKPVDSETRAPWAADDRIDDRFSFRIHYVVTKGNEVLSAGDRFMIERYPEWIRQLEPRKLFEILVFGWDEEYGGPRNRVTYYTDKASLLAVLGSVEVELDMEHARNRVAALEAELALVKSQYRMGSD